MARSGSDDPTIQAALEAHRRDMMNAVVYATYYGIDKPLPDGFFDDPKAFLPPRLHEHIEVKPAPPKTEEQT